MLFSQSLAAFIVSWNRDLTHEELLRVSSFLMLPASEGDIIARVEAAKNKITKNYGGGAVYYGQMLGGKIKYKNGKMIYTEGKRHGYGTYTDVNGWKYVGEWKNDKPHGQGTQTRPDYTVNYSGEWENGKKKPKK